MPTIAQLRLQQEKTDKSARRIAFATIGTMLTLSTAANVLTAWDHDTVSKVVAGVPPISLFITSALYERMRATKPIQIGMILTILVSLAFSWVHIAELSYTHHQPLYISIFLPVIIDVPMLFAGTIIINQRAIPETTPKAPTTPKTTPKPKTTRTITKTTRTATKALTTQKP